MENLIDTDMVLLDVEAVTRDEVIDKLSALFEAKNRLHDKEEYIKTVLEREKLFSTAIGSGVAIPHGKSTGVKFASIAVGRLKKEIQWGDSEEKVKVVFLLAVPEAEAGEQHLRILAQLSGRLMDDDFRDKLMELNDKSEIVRLIGFPV